MLDFHTYTFHTVTKFILYYAKFVHFSAKYPSHGQCHEIFDNNFLLTRPKVGHCVRVDKDEGLHLHHIQLVNDNVDMQFLNSIKINLLFLYFLFF